MGDIEGDKNIQTGNDKVVDVDSLVRKKSVFLIWEFEVGFFGVKLLSVWEDEQKAEWVKETLTESH